MNEAISYIVVVICCLIGIWIINRIVSRLALSKFSATTNGSQMKCSCSKEHIQLLVLPNNKGKSIDDVFEVLAKDGVEPKFHINIE